MGALKNVLSSVAPCPAQGISERTGDQPGEGLPRRASSSCPRGSSGRKTTKPRSVRQGNFWEDEHVRRLVGSWLTTMFPIPLLLSAHKDPFKQSISHAWRTIQMHSNEFSYQAGFLQSGAQSWNSSTMTWWPNSNVSASSLIISCFPKCPKMIDS